MRFESHLRYHAARQVKCQRRHARLPPWKTGFDSLYLHQICDGRPRARYDVAIVEIRVRFPVVTLFVGGAATALELQQGRSTAPGASHRFRDEGLMVSRRFREPELCGFDSHHPDRWTEEVGLSRELTGASPLQK